jgi:7-cyano-7-deazaguanine reductase
MNESDALEQPLNKKQGVLGQSVSYPNNFDASLLEAIPRQIKRSEIGIDEKTLPFVGEDIWNAFELSWLNLKGKPVVAIAEFRIPFNSANLVESKSFKLYLNSYNQTGFESAQDVQRQLIVDLSALIEAQLAVKIFDVDDAQVMSLASLSGENIDHLDIEVKSYDYQPDLLLDSTSSEKVTESLHSHLLKSNCLITNQPDWGSVEITYSGAKINRERLLQYLISFRQHNEFHEQCVERIWVDIMKYCRPEKLSVYARYTRRGGLDINPFRSNFEKVANNTRLARQ